MSSQLDCKILQLEMMRNELSLYGIFLCMNFFFLHEFIGTNKTICGMYDVITFLLSVLKIRQFMHREFKYTCPWLQS